MVILSKDQAHICMAMDAKNVRLKKFDKKNWVLELLKIVDSVERNFHSPKVKQRRVENIVVQRVDTWNEPRNLPRKNVKIVRISFNLNGQ